MFKKNFGLILSIFIGLVISLFYYFDFLKPLEVKIGYDFTFLIKPQKPPHPAIKIIGIDQDTLSLIGSYPFRRSHYVDLLSSLGNRPKIVGFDIIFSENSGFTDDSIFFGDDDAKFADAIKKSNNVILAMGLITTREKENSKNERMELSSEPLKEFLKNAKSVSVVNYFTDEDGILRKSKVSYKYFDTDTLTDKFTDKQKEKSKEANVFSYEIAKNYLDITQNKYINLPDEIYCNYQNLEAFKDNTFSFYDVAYAKSVDLDTFQNSIVLIGALAEGLQDRVSTPIGPMNGVEYHAQLISNILNNDYIRPMPKAINMVLILLASVIAYLAWKSVDTINQILLIILTIVLLYGVHILLFTNNIWISIVSIIIASIGTFVTLILFSQFEIARNLKSELENLIHNYESRKLQYKIYNPTSKLERNLASSSSIDRNKQKIRKLAEIGNNLTIQRRFLETLLNNIEISIIVTNSFGKITLINPAAQDFLTGKKKNKKDENDSSEDLDFEKDENDSNEDLDLGKDKNDSSEDLDLGKDKNDSNENPILKKGIIGNDFTILMGSIMPEIKDNLNEVYHGSQNLPVEYKADVGDLNYTLKLFTLHDDDVKIGNSNIVCLIEDVTNWHQSVNRDGLTTLWNQKYFKEHLEVEIQKTKRYKNSLSLIMMDVDHFKKFNDTYGHQTGDIVLKSIASVLHDKSRNTDITARYGGEEFSAILPMTDEGGAYIFAERVRKAIESLEILDVNGNPVGKVTASLGVSYYDDMNLTLKEFIERSDSSLYVCKDRGRNCVTRYSHYDFIKNNLNKYLPKEIEKNIEKFKNDLFLIMLDLDNLKKIGKHNGYEIEKFVIASTLNILNKTKRTEDIFEKYNEQNFVIILPNISKEDVLIFIKNIKDEVEKIEIFDEDGEPIKILIALEYYKYEVFFE